MDTLHQEGREAWKMGGSKSSHEQILGKKWFDLQKSVMSIEMSGSQKLGRGAIPRLNPWKGYRTSQLKWSVSLGVLKGNDTCQYACDFLQIQELVLKNGMATWKRMDLDPALQHGQKLTQNKQWVQVRKLRRKHGNKSDWTGVSEGSLEMLQKSTSNKGTRQIGEKSCATCDTIKKSKTIHSTGENTVYHITDMQTVSKS